MVMKHRQQAWKWLFRFDCSNFYLHAMQDVVEGYDLDVPRTYSQALLPLEEALNRTKLQISHTCFLCALLIGCWGLISTLQVALMHHITVHDAIHHHDVNKNCKRIGGSIFETVEEGNCGGRGRIGHWQYKLVFLSHITLQEVRNDKKMMNRSRLV